MAGISSCGRTPVRFCRGYAGRVPFKQTPEYTRYSMSRLVIPAYSPAELAQCGLVACPDRTRTPGEVAEPFSSLGHT